MNWRFKNWKNPTATGTQRTLVNCGPSCNQLLAPLLAIDPENIAKNTKRKFVHDGTDDPATQANCQNARRNSNRKKRASNIAVPDKHIKCATPWLNLWKK
jgi:hypothetical protein